jgi:hypothetical protein
MAYDIESDRVILFSGYTGERLLDDTWAYNYGGLEPPRVINTNPKNGAMDVSQKTNIDVEFSLSMNESATTGAISASPSISGSFSWNSDKRIVTWDPVVDLDVNTQYTIMIGKTARSQSGMEMAAPYTFTFKTYQPPQAHSPYIVTTNPTSGTTNISTTVKVNMLWNEDMNRSSAQTAFFSSPMISCAWTWSGVLQSCTPFARLNQKTQYTITVSTFAKDLAGNFMLSPYIFKFTTGSELGIVPQVVDTYPLDGAKEVEKDTLITITFSETMDRPSTEKTIGIVPSAQMSAVHWDTLGKTIMFTAALGEGKAYTITILKTARSLAGIEMISDYSFSFATRTSSKPISTGEIDLNLLALILIPITVMILSLALLLMRKKNRCTECGVPILKNMTLCYKCKTKIETSIPENKLERTPGPRPSESMDEKKRAIDRIRERRRRSMEK